MVDIKDKIVSLETLKIAYDTNKQAINKISEDLSAMKPGGTIDDAQIQAAVNNYMDANPVQAGATTEQVEQIRKNTEDISQLSEDKVSLPKDINGNVLAPTEGQTILFNEDGTTYYGTPQSSGGSIGGNMTDDGDLILTYSSQSSGGGVTDPETPTITGIVATYGGGDVPEGTSLLNLKNVTVIVQYSDGSTGSATDGYTLSLPDEALTLSVGVNTVTAEYKGFTATFEVTAYKSDETVESIYDSALYDVSIYSL